MTEPNPRIESLANLVTDKIDAMLAYWDASLICRFANAAYLDWFGKSKEEMIDKITIRDLLGSVIFEKNLPYIIGVLEGKPQTFEREIPLPDGKIRHSLARYFPDSRDGKVVGFFVHVSDVTPLKILEKQLKAANEDIVSINEDLRSSNEELATSIEQISEAYQTIEKQAKELSQMLDKQSELLEVRKKIISIVSHEFRTPLTSIQFALGFLRKFKNTLSPVQFDQKIDSASRQIQHLVNLTDDLLMIEKIDANKQPVQLEYFEIGFIRTLAEEMIMLDGGDIHVNYQIGNDQEVSVLSDKRLMQIIIHNLVGNAVKYSGSNKEITISAELTNTQLIIKVADKGIGIPPEDLKSLFSNFHRGKNVGSIQGTGLGLSIVKRSIDLMKGDIDVKSELNVGTEFTLHFPQALLHGNK
jgi:PAS domain S-box-containing protein